MTRMPFGKYRGVLVADLPDDYLTWLHGIELHEPLRTAVKTEFELRFTKPNTNTSVPSDVKVMASELIAAGYRKMSLAHHPDHGGSHQAMVLVNHAADFLRQTLRSTASPGGPA